MRTSESLPDLMERDLALRLRIAEPAPTADPAGDVLVTGATGFLGKYVVRELLRHRDCVVHCIVRADDRGLAQARLDEALKSVATDPRVYRDRLIAWPGSMERRRLGLSRADHDLLAERTAAIIHCAATVNWVANYRKLRGANVMGTREIIRLAAARRRKRIIFTSTMAVCFPNDGPDKVDEHTDMRPYIERMPLGYAQSKCVAENLLRQASNRGIPVSVIRPSLISGDTETGDVNERDLILELVASCVSTGSATDQDWKIDCVPVDFVARVIFTLGMFERPRWEVLNLFNTSWRDWRELVLWMNLKGYRTRLLPHAEWLAKTFTHERRTQDLYRYRGFFGAGKQSGETAPYEAYLEPAQCKVRNLATLQVLKELGVSMPALDGDLLGRYFDTCAARGIVPRVRRTAARNAGERLSREIVERVMSRHAEHLGRKLVSLRALPFTSSSGIFNEVSSAGVGSHVGIRRYAATLADTSRGRQFHLTLMVKTKPSDEVMQGLFVDVARLCDESLGKCVMHHRHSLGVTGAHERELRLYEIEEPRLRRITPRIYGTHRDPEQGIWAVVMEYVPETQTGSKPVRIGDWPLGRIEAAIRSISGVHAAWFRKESELLRFPWITGPLHLERAIETALLWERLVAYSSRFTRSWAGAELVGLQESILAGLEDWWPRLTALPATLIHNDFNPRNIIVGADRAPRSTTVIDWELATIGPPQHDTAELLCFTMPTTFDRDALRLLLEIHRDELQSILRTEIDWNEWVNGFFLSLKYLGIFRIPLYAMMHRFRKLEYLPNVVRNWQVLYRLANELRTDGDARPGDQPDREIQQGDNKQVLRP